MKREYHVAVTGCDFAEGTAEHPFRTINKAAQVAEAGDTVVVHAGEYREWVKPAHAGASNIERVTYEAAEGEKVVIKGSERITDWELVEGTVWKVTLPNSFFGDYNPYAEPLGGDWFAYPTAFTIHSGDVYLNGKSFFETTSLEEVKHPKKRETFTPPFSTRVEKILNPEQTVYQWYCEVDHENTTIYANFQGADPNEELAEINVRKCCFYPDKVGVDYITVRGFEMAQAACPWTPPTADQPGMLGAHWSKGWIIENNILHDAKCSAISIGKEASTGHNLSVRYRQKPGYQHQMEAVFRALQIGWSKEKIGSHIIRNNVIYDCGQNGIVGHMGCVFSEIYGNDIYNINLKHEFYGYEIAGIKLHAAIDVQIHHNRIHNCELGTWLDWQAQGTRVSSNLYYNNDRDFMVEVTHGPCLVDNNIFASAHSLDDYAQGSAFVNNLFCGKTHYEKVLDRSTPYHFPHTTQVASTAVVYGADDRYYNNIFVAYDGYKGVERISTIAVDGCGTAQYNGCTASYEEYNQKIFAMGAGDLELFQRTEQPVCAAGNAYLNGAGAFDRECENYVSRMNPQVQIVEQGSEVYLEFDADQGLLELSAPVASTETLGFTRITNAIFDDPNGNSIVLDTDLVGNKRTDAPNAGPIEGLKEGHNRMKIWG
ncbi:MAG: hypothetical protein DBY25_03660 [Clostridiales bacterium]|nr:MAG: hypothetical protein DBY25_03660 [Clostridiales bacterium]